ncbi:MAG TPA: nodulation protein NfeD, partial [Candidatus Eisenbacteria bacterium]|nr:nodulation protein NfeD [Candidatus Eisenbacteria bacterium]
HVLVVRLTGVVSPIMEDVLAEALRRADEAHANALLVEIDTPGGLESSMRDMVERILASPRPVIAYVTPSGAHAASAGVFLVMSADVAAMAPGTNIGAATPISMQGPMDSTLARKATNDAAAFARTVAAQRHRNAVWAERAVREAVAASEREAARDSIVDFVAGTDEEVLAKADGHTWHLAAGEGPVRTRGCTLERLEPSFRQRLLGAVADPNVAYILLMLGFYGLLFELQSPGAILPGIVGGICLILAFLALSALPVNGAGVALLVLGLVFLLAEVKVHSHGLLATGGALSLAIGALVLFQGGSVRVALPVALGVSAATVGFFLVVVGYALRVRNAPRATGAGGLLGRRAVALDRLGPGGRVQLGSEVWNAVATATVEAGGAVVVTGVEGLTLRVRPAATEG